MWKMWVWSHSGILLSKRLSFISIQRKTGEVGSFISTHVRNRTTMARCTTQTHALGFKLCTFCSSICVLFRCYKLFCRSDELVFLQIMIKLLKKTNEFKDWRKDVNQWNSNILRLIRDHYFTSVFSTVKFSPQVFIAICTCIFGWFDFAKKFSE